MSRELDIAKMHVNTLAWLAANPHDAASLARGPLGDALSSTERRGLLDDPDGMASFIEGVRLTTVDLLDRAGTPPGGGPAEVLAREAAIRAFGPEAQRAWPRPEPFGCE